MRLGVQVPPGALIIIHALDGLGRGVFGEQVPPGALIIILGERAASSMVRALAS